MAGIPEHLLKRAQEARDKAAGIAPVADGATASENVLVKVAENKSVASAPAASAPPPPPDPS